METTTCGKLNEHSVPTHGQASSRVDSKCRMVYTKRTVNINVMWTPSGDDLEGTGSVKLVTLTFVPFKSTAPSIGVMASTPTQNIICNNIRWIVQIVSEYQWQWINVGKTEINMLAIWLVICPVACWEALVSGMLRRAKSRQMGVFCAQVKIFLGTYLFQRDVFIFCFSSPAL